MPKTQDWIFLRGSKLGSSSGHWTAGQSGLFFQHCKRAASSEGNTDLIGSSLNRLKLFNQNLLHFSTSSSKNGNNIIPAVVYTNADTQKESILNDNKGKAGIYC